MSEQTAEKHIATRIGVVTSDARDKTRTVAVEFQEVHPIYGKRIKRHAKYQVHDETNESRNGDRVEIASCRPISKTKTFKLVRIVERAQVQA